MKTQEQIKEQITKEMEEMGYKLIPPFDFEVVDVSGMSFEARNSYYQNLSKRALEIEFQKVIKEFKL